MSSFSEMPCTAFVGVKRIASGALRDVAAAVKKLVDQGSDAPVAIFEDATSRPVEVDFRGSDQDVASRIAARSHTGAPPEPGTGEGAPRGPGRPKLGVVSREVTLLPRHWDWLGRQPGGASSVLRRLIDEARRANAGADRVREAQEATYRFMSAMAGDRPGFEEAARALFAIDRAAFADRIAAWPDDIRDHALRIAAPAFEEPA